MNPTMTVESISHPLSSVQSVIWLDQAMQPGTALYHIGFALQLDGVVDAALLQQAIDIVANQHDSLRMVLRATDTMPQQSVLPQVHIPLQCVDFSGAPDAEAQAQAFLQQQFQTPFQLFDNILWHSWLVQVSPTRGYWLLRFHHIMTDGFGVALIGHPIAKTYTALLRGQPLPDVSGPSYFDFLPDDQAYLQSSRYQRDQQFWAARFPYLPPALFDRSVERNLERSLEPGGNSAAEGPGGSGQHRWFMPRSLYGQLKQLGGGSAAHVLLAAMALYFGRMTAQSQVVIGVPVHNRSSAAQKRSIGVFSSVNPIGIELDLQQDFHHAMQSVAEQLQRCYRHQRFPLAEINRQLKLAHTGRGQIFDISFSLEAFDGDEYFGDIATTAVAMDNGHEANPMAWYFRDYQKEGDILVDFRYQSALFQPQEIEQLQQRWLALLQALVAQPDLPLQQIALLTAQERAQWLQFNATRQDYPGAKQCLHQLIEAQVAATPSAVALRYEDQLISYAELNRRANQLARRMQAAGVGLEARVAVCMERSPELVWSLLAGLTAGAAYGPLDPSYPAHRLAFLRQDSAPALVLGQGPLLPMLQGLLAQSADAGGVALWDVNALEMANIDLANIDLADAANLSVPALQPSNLAYIIYTSGSTGMPKGAMNQHDGVVNRLLWAQQHYLVRPHDVILQKTPFSFDVSVWELFLPLISGAQLLLARPQGQQDPVYLAQLCQQGRVSMLHFVPSMLGVFLQHAQLPACVQKVLCSGEALPYAMAQRFIRTYPQIELHNLYGPTEAAVDVTAWDCRQAVPGGRAIVPIGQAIGNIQVWVLDSALQLVPPGVPGEIYLGGIGVGRGYWQREQLSHERFIDNPLLHLGATVYPGKLYKTGDLGRCLPDGSIEYLGRN
ncbi:MAG: hypothetical protein RL748_3765, partial [Pseudomonadota bacterium]